MALTEDSGDSLDGLRILVLELVVLQITNEKWADRIHFVQFNSEYGAKENIIKMERKIKKNDQHISKNETEIERPDIFRISMC